MITTDSSTDAVQTHAIYGSAGMAAAGLFPTPENRDRQARTLERMVPDPELRKAVMIGQPGEDDFGREVASVFRDLNHQITISAVSTPDESNRAFAQARLYASRAYPDYREMLDTEKPELVSFGPGWGPDRHAGIIAALDAGAHVFIEGPFARTLAEADEIMEIARAKNLKVAAASPLAFDSVLTHLKDSLNETIGELREIRIFGPLSPGSGGEDLAVNGPVLFEIARRFGGDAESCRASIRKEGQPAEMSDSRPAANGWTGPVAGDDIAAWFLMNTGVTASFSSRLGLDQGGGGVELIGTKTSARIYADDSVTVSILQNPEPGKSDRADAWQSWSPESSESGESFSPFDLRDAAEDWLAAIDEGREPKNSMENAAKSLEMTHAIFSSGIRNECVDFPLAERSHPLESIAPAVEA